MPKLATDRVLSNKAIIWGALLVVLVAGAAGFLLLYFLGTAEAAPRLEAIRVASTIVLGAGGGVALYLAARRQRSTELTLQENARIAAENAADRAKDLALREKSAADTRTDAIERRITDLYTKAADQLGNDKAAVRLAGLYALERLANDTPAQRQTIVNLICAYLRMPYVPVDMPDEDDPLGSYELYEKSKQEGEVRHTAQEILSRRLSTSDDSLRWSGMNLNLQGAHLGGMIIEGGDFGSVDFSQTKFASDVSIKQTLFRSAVSFDYAAFKGLADFEDVVFDVQSSRFLGCQFSKGFRFTRTTFGASTEFTNLTVKGYGRFKECIFPGVEDFYGSMPPAPLSRMSFSCTGEVLSKTNMAFSEWVHLGS